MASNDTTYIDELQQNLIKAMDIIAGAKISTLEFDKTLVCTIKDAEKANRGEYVVENGSTVFTAYSANTDYQEGQKVYVSIPNGDMSAQKMISGKYMDSGENQYYTYNYPMKSFVNITGNLIPENKEFGLLANGPIEIAKKLLYNIPIENGKRYDRLGISAGFKTWLRALKTSFGSYGLEIDVTTSSSPISSSNVIKKFKYILDSSEFYGNPYNFETYYTQEKVIDISKLDTITNIAVYAYQNRNFLNNLRQPIPYERQDIDGYYELLPDNIFFTDLNIGLGYDKTNFEGDALLLYTLNGETYNDDITKEENAKKRNKQLQLRWIHKNENETMSVIETEESIPPGAAIHWYHYRLYEGVADELAGAFWEEIFPGVEDNLFNMKVTPAFGVNSEKYKVIIEYPSRESIYIQKFPYDEGLNAYPNGDPTYLNNELDILYRNLQSAIENGFDERDVAKLEEEFYERLNSYDATRQDYESNILTLSNEKPVADLATVTLIQGLKIICDAENYKGVYRIYTQNGEIKNSEESHQMRKMVASYKTMVSGESSLDTAEKIIWRIPLENTMIYPPEDGKEYDSSVKGVSYREEDGFAVITRDISFPEDVSIGDFLDTKTEQTFRIKNYLVQTATNNRVYCDVIKNNITYEAYTDMYFGATGTNGTNYTFVAEPEGQMTALILEEPQTLMKIKCSLFDYENKEMLGPKGEPCNGYQVSYKWYSSDDVPKIAFCNKDGVTSNKYLLVQNPEIEKDSKFKEIYAEGLVYYKKISEDNYREVSADEARENFDTEQYYIRQCDSSYGPTTEPVYLKLLNEYTEDEDAYPYFYILQASITNYDTNLKKNIRLTTLMPVAVRRTKNYSSIEGAIKIIYNSLGTNPEYYKQPYKLYYMENRRNIYNLENIEWKCLWNEDKDLKADSYVYYPEITDQGVLTPCHLHIEGLSKQVCVVGYDNNNDNKALAWIQPLIIQKDGYSSALLNSWDGNLTLNKENGTILSSMVGAGKKNSNNTFDGVLMGDVKIAMSEISQMGIYGFNQGEASFGLSIDGKAFFGKKDRGQILIDGNSGSIQSASYSQSPSAGMKIDLDDGIIDIKGVQITKISEDPGDWTYSISTSQPSIRIAATDPYFRIQGENNTLINISEGSYYLKSANYSFSSETGTYFNLDNGELYAHNFTLSAGSSGNYFYAKANSSGINFYVSANGTRLLNISDNSYYLQSANYSEGAGTKFDLQEGKLIGYNFSLSAKSSDGSIKIDSSGDPFLQIRYNDVNLVDINISGDGIFKLQSFDKKSYLDLGKNKFKFSGEGDYKVLFSDGTDQTSAFMIWDSGEQKNLVNINPYGDAAFYFRTPTFGHTDNYYPLGTQVDLYCGNFISSDLTIIGVSNRRIPGTTGGLSSIEISTSRRTVNDYLNSVITNYKSIVLASDLKIPFQIGPNFHVDWQGNVYCRNLIVDKAEDSSGTSEDGDETVTINEKLVCKKKIVAKNLEVEKKIKTKDLEVTGDFTVSNFNPSSVKTTSVSTNSLSTGSLYINNYGYFTPVVTKIGDVEYYVLARKKQQQ